MKAGIERSAFVYIKRRRSIVFTLMVVGDRERCSFEAWGQSNYVIDELHLVPTNQNMRLLIAEKCRRCFLVGLNLGSPASSPAKD
jgi:hypothetical protein